MVQQLLARKKVGDELDYEPRLNPINDYLEERLQGLEKSAAEMRSAGRNLDGRLDELFRSALQEVWGS